MKSPTSTPVNIVMIGTGYVGLVGGTCFAMLGHHVTCYDTDKAKISNLKKSILPIFEPGLENLVKEQVSANRLCFSDHLEQSLETAETCFVAVGTPTDPQTGRADMTYIRQAALDIAKASKGKSLLLIHKSTVPVGSAEMITKLLDENDPSHQIEVASNPEFLREGQAIDDFLTPDRVIIGTASNEADKMLRKIYQPLTDHGVPLVTCSVKSAEMIKYAANAFLAVKIAYTNEMADLCDKMDANIDDVTHGIGLDRRISPDFLKPGPGYGGSCFPKDTLEFAGLGKLHDSPIKIVEAAIDANQMRKQSLIGRIEAALPRGESLNGKIISLLGLAFKANTDDIRDSASLTLIPALIDAGAKVKLHDVEALANGKTHLKPDPNLCLSDDLTETLTDSDFAVIMTEWQAYQQLDIALLAQSLRLKLLIDFRNLYDPQELKKTDLTYISLGRP